MSVRRRFNWINSQRADIPHLRSIESSVSNDFDELLRGFITGEEESYILRGFEIAMSGAIGAAASGLQILVAEGCLFHGTSRESGTFYVVPSGTSPEILNSSINTKVQGAFVPNAINYIGIEYSRIVDDSTADTVYLWNPTSKNETSKNVPLARILQYRIVISTSIWAANVLPIAKITTDVAGNVVDVTDQRPMLFRLGTGGRSNPNPAYVYPWTNHSEGRTENSPTSNSSFTNPFRGGDKQLFNLKEWMDAVMSQFKELKGTVYWYSPNIGGSLVKLRQDLGNTVVTGRGMISHNAATAGKINWNQDIYIKLVGSRLNYKLLANPSSTDIILGDEEVAYINLVRGITIVPNLVFTNGSAVVASVGAVSWTGSLVAGDFVKLVSDDDTKYYQIQSVDSLSQVTLTTNFAGTSTGPSGAKSQYAWGVYETNPAPSTDRHVKIADRNDVPFGEDIFWFLLRSDNAGSTPRVYVRFLGSELEQGEDREISDNISEEILSYIGSTGETDSSPIYSTQLGSLTAEITSITLPAAASITSGQYFTINAADDLTEYYVWFNKNSAGGNPLVIGKTPIEVAISTGDTNSVVASAVSAAIGAISDFSTSVLSNVVTVTNADIGPATDAANVDVGGSFSISVTTQGSGALNNYVIDSENLTLSIKRLDKAILDNAADSDPQIYDEFITIVSGAPANDNEITGPILSGTNIVIPGDSRDGDAIKSYTVGKGQMAVFLNGVRMAYGSEFDEVGSIGTQSNTVQTLMDLVIGDVLEFTKL